MCRAADGLLQAGIRMRALRFAQAATKRDSNGDARRGTTWAMTFGKL
jgi:hypothetical protein